MIIGATPEGKKELVGFADGVRESAESWATSCSISSGAVRRRSLRSAVTSGVVQTGYFRIGLYKDTAEDQARFSGAEHAEQRVLEWVIKSGRVPLYLTGDSGTAPWSVRELEHRRIAANIAKLPEMLTHKRTGY